jgi:hypothetical protein
VQDYIDRGCLYVESYKNDTHTYTFTGPCIVTGKPYSITVPEPELYAHCRGGGLEVLKSLSLGDREFFKTGISPEGWSQLFPEGDEE